MYMVNITNIKRFLVDYKGKHYALFETTIRERITHFWLVPDTPNLRSSPLLCPGLHTKNHISGSFVSA